MSSMDRSRYSALDGSISSVASAPTTISSGDVQLRPGCALLAGSALLGTSQLSSMTPTQIGELVLAFEFELGAARYAARLDGEARLELSLMAGQPVLRGRRLVSDGDELRPVVTDDGSAIHLRRRPIDLLTAAAAQEDGVARSLPLLVAAAQGTLADWLDWMTPPLTSATGLGDAQLELLMTDLLRILAPGGGCLEVELNDRPRVIAAYPAPLRSQVERWVRFMAAAGLYGIERELAGTVIRTVPRRLEIEIAPADEAAVLTSADRWIEAPTLPPRLRAVIADLTAIAIRAEPASLAGHRR